MTDNVVMLDTITRLDVPADRILTAAMEKLEGVVIAGYTNDGEEYFASSYADGGDALWLIERLKMHLLRNDDA